MRRSIVPLMSLLTLAMLVYGLSLPAPLHAQADPDPQGRQAPDSEPYRCNPHCLCDIFAQTAVFPPTVLAGETATVTHRVYGWCREPRLELSLVLAIDSSELLTRQETEQVKDGLRDLVYALRLKHHPETRVALVDAAKGGRTVVPLTNDTGRLVQAIDRIERDGASALAPLVREAWILLQRARNDARHTPGTDEVVVFVPGALPGESCDAALRELQLLQRDGARPIMAYPSRTRTEDGRRPCRWELSRATWRSIPVRSLRYLPSWFGPRPPLVVDLSNVSITVSDALEPGLTLVPGSHQPSAQLGWNARSLRWSQRWIPGQELRFSYRVVASEPGHHRVAERAWFYWDAGGLETGIASFPTTPLGALGPAISEP